MGAYLSVEQATCENQAQFLHVVFTIQLSQLNNTYFLVYLRIPEPLRFL